MSYITPDDEANEDRIGARLGPILNCEFRRFARYTPLDQWAMRDERMVALAELKHRTHEYGAFPDTWLPLRKWLALVLGQQGCGVPAIYGVEWGDGAIGYAHAADINPRGRIRIVRADNAEGPRAVEPVIEVPLDTFTMLGKGSNE